MAQLDEVIGFDTKEAQQRHEDEMLRLSKPTVWNVHMLGNSELKWETGFEGFMFEIQEHTTENLDEITVFRFYSLLDYIKKKNSSDGRG